MVGTLVPAATARYFPGNQPRVFERRSYSSYYSNAPHGSPLFRVWPSTPYVVMGPSYQGKGIRVAPGRHLLNYSISFFF